MRYRITHTTKYAYSEPVPVFQNKVHLAPRDTNNQSCLDYRLLVVPEASRVESREDYFGNRVDYFSIINALRNLTVTSISTVQVSPPQVVPSETPAWEVVREGLRDGPSEASDPDAWRGAQLFAFASGFVPIEAAFAEYAADSFPEGRPVFEACADLTRRVYEDFQYDPRATDVSTPVDEVLAQRAGVCQDFAHLQIACLRSLGLAARYVSGYLRTEPPPGKPRLVGADASHAWLSVYCGDTGWVDFDPTNNVVPTTDHITLAHGRDYGDVCPIQGVFVGGGDHSMTVSVDVLPLDAKNP